MTDRTDRRLNGSWTLVAYEEVDADGSVEYPLGREPVGSIIYANDGRMSAQIMNRTWQPRSSNPADAYFLAYSGTFKVDEEAQVVRHHIEVSAIPSWLGTIQQREIRFDTNGDLQLLTLSPVLTRTGMKMARLRWCRYGASARPSIEQSRS